MLKKVWEGRLLIACLFLLGSWTNDPVLRVRTEPLYPDYLASERIDIRDPLRSYFLGEQIVVYYRFPIPCDGAKKMVLTLRTKDHSYETLIFPLCEQKGYWVYRLVNEEYWKRGGVLSYKVELWEDEQMVHAWRHHLYVDLIVIPTENALVNLTDRIP